MRVLKFGGSSLADAAAIAQVAHIVRKHSEVNETVLVCSACGGVTNKLAQIAELVRSGHTIRALAKVWRLRARHRTIWFSLNLEAGQSSDQMVERARVWNELEELGEKLRASVAGTAWRDAGDAWADSILAYGERASARLVAGALRSTGLCAEAVDATRFLITDRNFQNAAPLRDETRRRGREILLPLIEKGAIPVVTGFIGATLARETTTLGRNSSDYSAAIVGDVIDADEVWLWTDVDGVFDSDPRRREGLQDEDAEGQELTLLDELSYDQALHMANGGAKVIHPRTIEPLREKEIVLRIRNTFRPEHPGTRISGGGNARPGTGAPAPLAAERAAR
ncbi:MAG TPA: aspartate kinase [Candidatus Acidoferrum sp.]|nr:aspartate kinase [Candidatus Acidoferrum sp.]